MGALDKIWRMPALYGLGLALVAIAVGHPVPDGLMRPRNHVGATPHCP